MKKPLRPDAIVKVAAKPGLHSPDKAAHTILNIYASVAARRNHSVGDVFSYTAAIDTHLNTALLKGRYRARRARGLVVFKLGMSFAMKSPSKVKTCRTITEGASGLTRSFLR